MSGASSSEGAQQHSAGIDDTSRPTNRLAKEQSPYLLQHAHNPASHAPSIHALQRPSLPPCMHHISPACRWTGTPGGSQHLTRPKQRTSQSFSVSGTRPATGEWCMYNKLGPVACSICCYMQATPAHVTLSLWHVDLTPCSRQRPHLVKALRPAPGHSCYRCHVMERESFENQEVGFRACHLHGPLCRNEGAAATLMTTRLP